MECSSEKLWLGETGWKKIVLFRSNSRARDVPFYNKEALNLPRLLIEDDKEFEAFFLSMLQFLKLGELFIE